MLTNPSSIPLQFYCLFNLPPPPPFNFIVLLPPFFSYTPIFIHFFPSPLPQFFSLPSSRTFHFRYDGYILNEWYSYPRDKYTSCISETSGEGMQTEPPGKLVSAPFLILLDLVGGTCRQMSLCGVLKETRLSQTRCVSVYSFLGDCWRFQCFCLTVNVNPNLPLS